MYGSAWGPPAVANAFQFPVQSGYNGAGATIGIIIDSDVKRTDLTSYLSYFAIPTTSRTVTTENIAGTIAGNYTADQDEATLDTETIAGLAPGANVIIYDIPDLTSTSVNDGVEQAISDGTAKVISMSFAGCETSGSKTVQAPVFAEGAAAGITFVASSGDWGDECYNGSGYTPGVGYPASDPNVTGVGGNQSQTSLTSTVAWNDSAPNATGGGISAQFTLPSYQSGVSGLASTSARNVPDVAMPAENDAIYLNSAWAGADGTSWSAPEIAAMFGELGEYCRANLGAINALLYQAHASAGADFLDITSGNNQYAGTNPYYTATTGYDDTTGLGIPKGMPLAGTLCPGRVLTASSRRIGALVQTESASDRAGAYAVDVRPPAVARVPDLGERDASATMSVQIVLTPAAARMGQDGPVIATLRGAGLTVTRTFANHAIVDASGTTAQIEALFGSAIHQYAQPGHGTRYAPAAAVTIPASLAPYLSGAILDNFVTMRAGR
jgi:subtilase family serine protease